MKDRAYFNFPESFRKIVCPICGRTHTVEMDIEGFRADGIYQEALVCGCGSLTNIKLVSVDHEKGEYEYVTLTYKKGMIDFGGHISDN